MWATNLSGANLIKANLRRVTAVGANLRGANLSYADFSGATLEEVDFSTTKLRRAKLRRVRKVERCIWRGVEIDETTELSPDLRNEIEDQLSQG